MNPVLIFVLQFLWFLLAWTALAVFIVEPKLRDCHDDDAVAIWLAPQLFRVLGLGLLVPNLSPGMPRSFAVPTALGDSATAVLAVLAIIALRQRWPRARQAVWACNLVGTVDLAVALPHAAAIGAARYLEGQWYVPALGVPLIIVSHVLVFRTLIRRGAGPPRNAA